MAKEDLFAILLAVGGGAILIATGSLNPIFDALKGKSTPKPSTPRATPPAPLPRNNPYVPTPVPLPASPEGEDIPVPIPLPPVTKGVLYHLAKLRCQNTKIFTKAELDALGIQLLLYQPSPANMTSCQECNVCLEKYIVVSTADATSGAKLESLGFKKGTTIIIKQPPPPVPPTPIPQPYNLVKLQCSNTTLFTRSQLEALGVKVLAFQMSPSDIITCQACNVCLHSWIVVTIDSRDSASVNKLLSLGFKKGSNITLPTVPPPPPPPPPPLPTGTSLEFAAVGDWDLNAHTVQTVSMINAKNLPVTFALGDYPYHSESPQQFASILGPTLKQKIKMVRGNHETPAWIQAVNGQTSTTFSFNAGNVCFIVCDSETGNNAHAEAAATSAQANPAIDWIVAGIHRPTTPYNDLSTGGDSPGRSRALVPVWEKFSKVRLVLSGHWHNYQRSKEILRDQIVPKGVSYVVVGTAGASLNPIKGRSNYSAKQVQGQYGFLHMMTTPTTMRGLFISHHNQVLDDFTIMK